MKRPSASGRDKLATSEALVAALAALSICESLLLSLQERGLLDEAETIGLLEDVISAHRNAAADSDSTDLHTKVTVLVTRIMDGENTVHAMRRRRKHENSRF